MNLGGWQNVWVDDILHLIPVNDMREHELTGECWCGPEEENDGKYYCHHSADGREDYETGLRKVN